MKLRWPIEINPKPQVNVDEIVAMAVNQAMILNQAFSLRGSGTGLSGTYDAADTLHNIYLDFGYPDQLDFYHFWNMFRRFGIARRIVSLPVDIGWSTAPVIESDNKQFLADFEKLIKDFKFWQRLRALDLRQRVGRYGGMYMRVRDGKKPHEALEGKLNGPASLLAMTPLYESQLRVKESDTNPESDTYGQPLMYEYSSAAPGSRNEKVANTISIHASRVVPASEGADDGSIYGISSLEAPYNSLMDLRKVIGAGAEGFYKNAAQSIVFKLMDMAGAKIDKTLLADFNDNYDEFAHNRFRRSFWTPGMDAENLQSSLTNPKEFFQNALNDAAAASDIPATILIGQQTGRLASDEDSDNLLASVQSRRLNFMTEMTQADIDWFIKYGILPKAKYEIEWGDLLARSDEEKLKNSDTMASVNQKQFQSGGQPAYTVEEIREAGGFEPIPEEEMPSEELPDDMIDVEE